MGRTVQQCMRSFVTPFGRGRTIKSGTFFVNRMCDFSANFCTTVVTIRAGQKGGTKSPYWARESVDLTPISAPLWWRHFCLSLCVSLSFSVSLFHSISLTHTLALSVSLSLSLSHTHTHTHTHKHMHTHTHTHTHLTHVVHNIPSTSALGKLSA